REDPERIQGAPHEEAAPGVGRKEAEAEELRRSPDVPGRAHRKDDEHVERAVTALPTQRDVDVVAQPEPQRDVPAPPEVGGIDRLPGREEVLLRPPSA